jgi:hypothetical protein
MHLHNPCLILVPDTFLSAPDAALVPSGKRSASTSLLIEYIGEEFPGIQVESVGRRYWNDSCGEPFSGNIFVSVQVTRFLGLEFILQLCVEDDERAGTILAVSNKYVAHTPMLMHLNLEPQVLCPICRLCPLQIHGKRDECPLCSSLSSNSLRACGWHYDGRSRHCTKSRARWEHDI